MSDTKDERPGSDNFANFVLGFGAMPCRVVLWILVIGGIACTLFFGYRDVGSYAGYAGGSIMKHDTYEDTAWTSAFGDSSGLRADDVNKVLADRRAENIPGMVIGVVVTLGTVAFAWASGFALANLTAVFDALESDDEYVATMKASYDRDHGEGAYNRMLHDDTNFIQGLASCAKVFSYETAYLFMPWTDDGIPGTTLDAESIKKFRSLFESAEAILCKCFLVGMGVRRTSDGHLTELIPGIPFAWPSKPEWAEAEPQPAPSVDVAAQEMPASADAENPEKKKGVSAKVIVPVALLAVAAAAWAMQANSGAGVSGLQATPTVSDSMDSDEIEQVVNDIPFGSDGSTGTYQSIPDTDLKQVWLNCMPQSAISGITYSISADGRAITLSYDQQAAPENGDTFRDMLAALVDATIGGYNGPDRFFQDASGTWYQFSESGYRVLHSAGSTLTLVIMVE